MIKGYAQWFDANSREFTQETSVLAEDTCVDALVEIDASLHWDAPARELRTRCEAEVPNLSDDFMESRRCHDVVVHQNQVLLWSVALITGSHDSRDKVWGALLTVNLRDAAETAFAGATRRCIREVRAPHRIRVGHLP